jgi:hypothetical protein
MPSTALTAENRATLVARRQKATKPSAPSLIIYLCGCTILFLLCVWPVLHRALPIESAFGAYWASGAAAIHGLNPYAAYPEDFAATYSRVGGPASVPDVNLNPPLLLPLFQAAAHLSFVAFCNVITVVSFAVIIFSIFLLLRARPEMSESQLLWLFLCAPTLDFVGKGQIYFILFFLTIVVWLGMGRGTGRGRDLLSALSIGAMVAIKPTFVFWPVFLLLRGDRKLAVRSILAALVLSLAPVLIYGPHVYLQWFDATKNDLHWLSVGNVAIGPYFRRLGLRPLGVGLQCVLALVLALYVWRRKPDQRATTTIALSASILCGPHAWLNYALLLGPAFVSRKWSGLARVAAFVFLLPPGLAFGLLFKLCGPVGMEIGSGIYPAAVFIMLFTSILSTSDGRVVTHLNRGVSL